MYTLSTVASVTLLPFEVKVAIKDMIFLIFQKWCKAIPVVFWKYLMMYLGQFRYTMNNQPKIVFCAKITKPFTNYHKFLIENFLSGTITFGGQKWSSWEQYKIKLMKCPKLLLPFQPLLSAFVVSRDRWFS